MEFNSFLDLFVMAKMTSRFLTSQRKWKEKTTGFPTALLSIYPFFYLKSNNNIIY